MLSMLFAAVISLSIFSPETSADEMSGKAASMFGYALNDEMLQYGILSTEDAGAAIEGGAFSGIYPSGVIYADILNFDNNDNPYLVIFRADSQNICISTDIFCYDEKNGSAEKIATLDKSYSGEPDTVGELTIGYNDTNRYIVYNEYINDSKVNSEFYTVIDGTAFQYVNNPDYAQENGVVSFNAYSVVPNIDISTHNLCLDEFFSRLKNASAGSVSYEDIYEKITLNEEEKLETVLTKAAQFRYVDIGQYADMRAYDIAMASPDADNLFYQITNLYNIGEEMYYVRFATNKSFYNYAILRRTSSTEDGYQILAVRTDSIPLSDIELESLKEVYSRNKLVYKKARGTIETEDEPVISIHKTEKEKPLSMPKPVNKRLRAPIALIGGGICLALLVIFWLTMLSDDDK